MSPDILPREHNLPLFKNFVEQSCLEVLVDAIRVRACMFRRQTFVDVHDEEWLKQPPSICYPTMKEDLGNLPGKRKMRAVGGWRVWMVEEDKGIAELCIGRGVSDSVVLV